ncbi:MAG: hypothetical protein L6Q81_17585, partial [Bacteroidia bacterium]|nr:hypothetical protein [Bacteroidia bacterium]
MLNSLRLKSVLSVAVSFTCLFASAQNSFSKMNTPAVPTAESSHEGHGFSYVDYSSRMDKDINPESTEAFDMTPTPRFEENKGQWDSQVTYKTELTNGNIFFGKTGYTVQF